MDLPSHLRLRVTPLHIAPSYHHPISTTLSSPFTSELRKNREEGKYEVKGVKIVHYEGPDKKKRRKRTGTKARKGNRPVGECKSGRPLEKKEQIRNGGAT